MNYHITRWLLAASLFLPLTAIAQSSSDSSEARSRLESYFQNYRPKRGDYIVKTALTGFSVDNEMETVTVTADEKFAEQELTPDIVEQIYREVKRLLPQAYQGYRLRIRSHGMSIEDIVPNRLRERHDRARDWGDINYQGRPWVNNESRPNEVSHGLQGRHLSINASHGRYYDSGKGRWKWQRPNLFCTTEDLFTQTIVIPYLIPMLENAGAVVFSTRERDWQRNEAIVDNDDDDSGRHYQEQGHGWSTAEASGFAFYGGNLRDQENPFSKGTVRQTATTSSHHHASHVSYRPTIPESGRYAVYVSYATVSGSIDDAHYTVIHQGQETHFTVNQRMGGGTWVYLGTFDFDKGCDDRNRVVLTNYSSQNGYVTTDAVRFGGGMGLIMRPGGTSHLPRCLEGARYNAQWSGAPYDVYSPHGGKDDYRDDIHVRGLFTNWIAGGSCYVPHTYGKRVPIELELAVHSDAGYDRSGGNSLIGTLGICTTDHNNGRLDAGISRMASRDFADALIANIMRDVEARFGRWHRRLLYDRNYAETRIPVVPSAIIETLSHQNFGDLRYGLDPNFRFTMARAIYKGILQQVSSMHNTRYVVQPLQPENFLIEQTARNKVKLSWTAVKDPQEPTADPSSYNLYTALDDQGFDNGVNIHGTSHHMELQPGHVYHFRVTAVNKGGESFPTEVLSAQYTPQAKHTVLIVNGFHRLSGPAVVDSYSRKGFDLDEDPGVTYGRTIGWSGRQLCFDNEQRGKEGSGALGYCGEELQGKFIAGNDFDYVRTHADAISTANNYNIVSCSSEAVENGLVNLNQYDCVDLVLGLEKDDGHSLVMYKSFNPAMMQKLSDYANHQGSVMVSGSYVGSDMQQMNEQEFLQSVLMVRYGGSEYSNDDEEVNGLGSRFDIYRHLNEEHYAAHAPNVLHPAGMAICAMQYSDGRSAAVAYNGGSYRSFVMGFPFECVKDRDMRGHLMRGIMNYLLEKKTPKKTYEVKPATDDNDKGGKKKKKKKKKEKKEKKKK